MSKKYSSVSLWFMKNIPVKLVNSSPFDLPSYATAYSSGMDIRANLDQPLVFTPGERVLVPTGLYIELPDGYEAQIRPRSGLAIKQGITCLNSPGTIDADYRGEIKVILINHSREDQIIEPGDRIAQMIIAKVERADLILVQQLDKSDRGDGGFGHTGKK